jgi:curved DNA-binding protein CbpA
VGSKNLYELIHVPNFSNQAEIKAAFWQLAKLYHPDTSKADHYEAFLEIRNAYELLSNQEKKRDYDARLASQLNLTTHTKRYKIRADRVWIAKYKADQLKKNNAMAPPRSKTQTQRNSHWGILVISLLIAIVLLLIIVH